MSRRQDRALLSDMVEAIHRASSYVAELDYEQFRGDTKTQDAVVRNLEIIGEAAKNVSEELRRSHSEIPWKALSSIRNKLIHQYFGVNLEIVWNAVTRELPEILAEVNEILKTKWADS